jgi:hypothetical protein
VTRSGLRGAGHAFADRPMALTDRRTNDGSTKQHGRCGLTDWGMAMQQILREELRPVQTASLSPSWRRRGIFTPRLAFVFAGTLTAFVACEPATAAVCHVPAAVLCQGCVERLSIRVMPDGVCRISFASRTAPSEAAEAGKFVDINVDAGSPRPVRRRASTSHLSDARPVSPLRRSTPCFVFNGRQFCE